jgi:signal transduction histidine kinase
MQTITLRARKELKGVLLILGSGDQPKDEMHHPNIKPLLRTITTILSSIVLLSSERQRLSRLQQINKISQSIDSLTEEDKLYVGLVQQIQSSFGYDHVAIYLIEKENRSLQMKALAGKYSKIIPKDQVIPLDQGIVGWVAMYGKTLLSNEARHSPYFLNNTPDQIPTEAELCVPIRVDGEIIGVLNIEHSELLYFDKEDISSVELLADRIGVAIKNARLYSELRKSHMTLEAIASSVGYGIMIIDREFRVKWINRTISKWGFENAIGSPCHQLLNRDTEFYRNCPSSNTFQTGKISRDVFSTQDDKHYMITAIPITDSTGFVTNVLEVVEDVTATRRTQEELESLKRGLVQAQQLASIGELAANIVHEIRNPMNAITQAIGILATDLVLNDVQNQLMNVLKEELARLNDTLNTYHLLARKKEERQFSEGDLKSVIEKVVSLLRTDQSIASRISFNIKIEDCPLTFRFDSNSMKQVFWNLLLNAVESIKEKGEITILTRRAPSHILISIEDNGIGIEENQFSKIFEPFYSTKRQGAGLGLPIVRRIIEDHDWKITVEGGVSHGTRFTIIIPTNR